MESGGKGRSDFYKESTLEKQHQSWVMDETEPPVFQALSCVFQCFQVLVQNLECGHQYSLVSKLESTDPRVEVAALVTKGQRKIYLKKIYAFNYYSLPFSGKLYVLHFMYKDRQLKYGTVPPR